MSREVTAHFIGGPWDGRVVVLREPRDYFEVAVLPPLPAYIPVEEEFTEAITVERFTYHREYAPGEQIVFIPSDWRNDPKHTPGEKMINALLRGYVGRL